MTRLPETTPERRKVKGHLARCLLLATVLAAAFGSSLRLPFFMDDYLHLTLIRDPSLGFGVTQLNAFSTEPVAEAAIREMLPWWADPGFRFHYFRPVPTLLMALDLALWDIDPRGFHLTSLALHILCIVLLYGFALRLGLRPAWACLGSLAAGLHFNNLFVVSWMPNQDINLAAIFLIGLLWFYDVYLERVRRGGGRGWPLAAAFLMLVLGVLSKENLVLAPALLLVLARIRSGEPLLSARGWLQGARLRPLLPFFAFSFLYVLWYAATGHGVSTGYMQLSAEKGLAGNLLLMTRNLYFYLVSFPTFLPPDFPEIRALLSSRSALPVAAAVAALAAGLIVWKRRLFGASPALRFLPVWFLLFLFTPLWFVPLGRLLYLSTLAWGLLAAALLQTVASRISRRFWRKGLAAAFSLYCLVLPFCLDAATLSFLDGKGDRVHLDLERTITRLEMESPEKTTVFLLNVPNPASVYLAGLVHRFYHPETRTRICALGNAGTPPEIREVGTDSFCLRNPEGLIETEVPFPLVKLEQGSEVAMPGFRVTQKRVASGILEEACFVFPRHLRDPQYLFLSFQGDVPVRPDLPATGPGEPPRGNPLSPETEDPSPRALP